MSSLDTILNKFRELDMLLNNENVYLEDIDPIFKKDIMTFIQGETISIINSKTAIGKNLYRKWLEKLNIKGFDYEIDFKTIC